MLHPDPIVLEIREPAAIIHFVRPGVRNSLSIEVQNRLEEILSKLAGHPAIENLIFTGTGNIFLSGADISELDKLDSDEAFLFSEKGQGLFQKIADAQLRTIAAINGYCLGGGLDFALACDLRIASPTAEFAHPGARLGIITGWGGTQRLPRLIGKTRASEIFLTGRRVRATEALEIGLVDVVAETPLDYALRLVMGTEQTEGSEIPT